MKSWAILPTRCVKAPKRQFTAQHPKYRLLREKMGLARRVLVAGCNGPEVVGEVQRRAEPRSTALRLPFSLYRPSRLYGNEPRLGSGHAVPFGAASELDLAKLEQTLGSHSIRKNYMARLYALNRRAVK